MTYAKEWGANKTTREYLYEFDEKRNAKKLSMQQAIVEEECNSTVDNVSGFNGNYDNNINSALQIPYFKDIYNKVEKGEPLNVIEKFIWDHGYYSRKVDEESFRKRFAELIIHIKLSK